ncbi:3-phytase, partial [Pseudomonas sp. P7759]|nr:3-phytase [Pseudomonas sp. P7759]
MRISKLYLLIALATCGPAMAADLALVPWAPNLNAEAVAFLPGGPQRLAASTRDGLQLLDHQGAELARFKGNFSSLDTRAAGTQVLVASLDNDRQQALLVSLDAASKTFGKPLYLPTRDYPVNGLCLFRDAAANLFVFLVGEEGKGEQWLVGNGSTLLGEPQRVRGLPLPPSAQFCQVDDATQQLLVNEENVGWWAYPAHPEAEVKRTPVALFDNPKREAGAMA